MSGLDGNDPNGMCAVDGEATGDKSDLICRPSQFLEDFPAELVEEWNVGNDNAWSDDEPF